MLSLFFRTMGFKDDLTFAELDKVLTHYIEQEKSQDCFLGKSPNRGFGNLSVEDHSKYMTDYVLESGMFKYCLNQLPDVQDS